MKLQMIIGVLAVALAGTRFTDYAQDAPDQTGLKITIDLPETDEYANDWTYDPTNHITVRAHPPVWKRHLYAGRPESKFYVVLQNTSASPVVLGGSAIGGFYHCLSFEITGEDGKTTTAYPNIIPAASNVPISERIPPGESTVFIIHWTAPDPRQTPHGSAKTEYPYDYVHEPGFFFNFPANEHIATIKLRAKFEGSVYSDSPSEKAARPVKIASSSYEVTVHK